jgi:serine/threonine protein kinase
MGTRLGPYEIASLLGVGGMGEVYRARDAKLGREVALKVISPEFAHDEQRMARFQREAKVLASFNHPHIAAIYGFEDSTGIAALVIELVEGPTLSERIASTPVPVEDALPIARQIADALEYAHERGIIHRDLKPANVKLTQDGNVKVLDFGLAKALQDDSSSGDLSNSPTLTMGSTKAGIILGTAAYMSPEQAKGKTADRRADIWSFGVVLFEMLSGKQAFGGETVSDSLAAIIKDVPDWSQLPARTPRKILDLLQRCLQKDPKQRLQAIGDARIAIDEAIANPSADETPMPAAASSSPSKIAPPTLLPWLTATAFAIAFAAALFYAHISHKSAARRTIQLSFAMPPGQQLDVVNGSAIAISPDGLRVAFSTREPGSDTAHLFVRELDKSAPLELDSSNVLASPFFSPDSQWIGYFSAGSLKKVSVRGGAPIAITPVVGFRGGSWGDDGTIVYPAAFTSVLSRVSASGGTPTALTHFDSSRAEITHRWPDVLPGSKAVLYTASADNNFFARANLLVAKMDSGDSRVLVENAYFGRYVPGGYLAYVSQGTLFVAPFDLDALKLTGPAVPVIQGIRSDISNAGTQLSVSASGTLVYLPGTTEKKNLNMVLLDRQGNSKLLLNDQPDAAGPRFSPDGKKIAFQRGTAGLWVYDIERQILAPITADGTVAVFPRWTPDGSRIAYAHVRTAPSKGLQIYWRRADGVGEESALTPQDFSNAYPTDWSADGKTLLMQSVSSLDGSCCEAFTLAIGPDGKPQPPHRLGAQAEGRSIISQLTTRINITPSPAFSPDGHWIAYTTADSGVPLVFVLPFPSLGGKWQISPNFGEDATWSKTRPELFYLQDGGVSVVSYSEHNGAFLPGKEQVLFKNRFETRAPFSSYDVTADGQHFVAFQSPASSAPVVTEPSVILNWVDAIKPIVAASQNESPQ